MYCWNALQYTYVDQATECILSDTVNASINRSHITRHIPWTIIMQITTTSSFNATVHHANSQIDNHGDKHVILHIVLIRDIELYTIVD